MNKEYWLIEYREEGQTVGYLRDVRHGDGGLDVLMTRDSNRALRFDNRVSAELIIGDTAFQRQQPHPERFFVEGYMDCAGPTHAEIDAEP